MARRCAVLGSPIAHSLSPVIHTAAYERLGLDWTYDAIEVGQEGLAGFFGRLDGSWRGLSLTMPLKRAALPLLDDVSPTAATVGAVNTVLLERGRRSGDNTDVPGLVRALAEQGATAASSAVVLGTGATAASAIAALARLGVDRVSVRGRNAHSAAALARWAASLGVTAAATPLGDAVTDRADVLVSTVPAAAVEHVVDRLVAQADVVADVGYHPWPSTLLVRAKAAGRVTVTGLDLLAHQAVLQVRAMTGGDVAVDALRDAALAALRSRP